MPARSTTTFQIPDTQSARLSVRILSPLMLILMLAFNGSPDLNAQSAACPAGGGVNCGTSEYCVGVNAGFFNMASLDRPFIDQMRSANIDVRGYVPNDILRNAEIPLDANKYPTDVGKAISVRFYLNIHPTYTEEQMPPGRYVVLWDGLALKPAARGENITSMKRFDGRVEFELDPSIHGGAWFQYENAPDQPHVTNIRIVPIEYEEAYSNWSWTQYRIGAATNPPIFFPQWLDKMSSGCAIRFVNSNGTNDLRAVRFARDSSTTRIKPTSSTWYEGFGLGLGAEERHHWPWELMIEAVRQTNTLPWINFRVMTWENLVAGDSFVSDIAKLFHEHHDGPVYVEYGNEIWNTGFPFFIATRHVQNNGPGVNNNLEENYSLRNDAIQKAFADAYGDDACLAIGVIASQGRNSFRGRQALFYSNKEYIDVISPGMYVGDDIVPNSSAWNFIADLRAEVDAGVITRASAFNALRREILTGSAGVINRNWRNDIAIFGQQYVELAERENVCMAVYEMGLHMRVDGIDRDNADHVAMADFVHDYKRSRYQGAVESEMHEWLKSRITGPGLVYANFMKDGSSAFAYWDSTFEAPEDESPQAGLIRYYRDAGGPLLKQLAPIGIRLKRLNTRHFSSVQGQTWLLAKYEELEDAIDAGERVRARRVARQFSVRLDGCGTVADNNDFLSLCSQQLLIQQSMVDIVAGIESLPD